MRVKRFFEFLYFFFSSFFFLRSSIVKGSSSAAYFRKPLVVCQTFLSFKCGEEEMRLSVSVHWALALWSDKIVHLISNNTLCFFFFEAESPALAHTHISHFSGSLFSVKFAGGQPHSSGNERSVGLLLRERNCRRVLKRTNFPQCLCVFVLLGDGGCFTVPLLHSFGLESIPSWPEFGRGSCILKGRIFASWGWRQFVSCLSPATQLSCCLTAETDERQRISQRNLITQQPEWLNDNKSSSGRVQGRLSQLSGRFLAHSPCHETFEQTVCNF